MLVIGLTGATGAGKGLFGKVAAEHFDALHIDTDKTAREVVEPGTPCLREIVATFGEKILHADGSLDRARLGEIVFSDTQKLQTLNRLTHHYVTDRVKVHLEKAETDGKRICVVDAPLLFESGEDAICDTTVGVVAREDVRFERILARDGITDQAAKKRMNAGKPEQFYRENCHHILENNGSVTEFTEKAKTLIEKLLAEYRNTTEITQTKGSL